MMEQKQMHTDCIKNLPAIILVFAFSFGEERNAHERDHDFEHGAQGLKANETGETGKKGKNLVSALLSEANLNVVDRFCV